MFHAIIRTDQDAFHLIGDLDAYAWQTLQQHVRSARREHDDVRLRLALDPLSHQAMPRHMRRWVRRLIDTGIIVEVVDTSD